MKYVVFYNPNSGRTKRQDTLDRVRNFFSSKGAKYELVLAGKGQSVKLIGILKKQKNVRLAVIGGDGSLRIVAEAMYNAGIKIPVAFIPQGSANINAISFGIPLNLEKALEKLVNGKKMEIDMGIINDRHIFLIAAVFGYVADFSIKPSRNLKKKIGFWAYAIGIHRILIGLKNHPFILNGCGLKKKIEDAHSVIILNHLDFGSLRSIRNISARDGILDFFVLRGRGIVDVARTIKDFFRKNQNTKRLDYFKFKELEMSGENFKGKIHLDGDLLRDRSDVYKIKNIHKGFTILT